jgi:exopolysaccharide production protein ExoZ
MDNAKLYISDTASQRMHYIADFGQVGVHIFFVISGFIMIYTCFKPTAGSFDSSEFLLRRLLRIYPIYLFYSVAYIALFGTIQYKSAWNILGGLLLLPGYAGTIISQGWTLSYELYFYLCFSLFMLFGLLRGIVITTLFFLLSIITGVIFHFTGPALYMMTNSLLLEFLFGVWVAYLYLSGIKLNAVWADALVILAIIAFAVGIILGYTRWPSVLVWGVPSALLVAGSVFRESAGRLPNSILKLSFLGDSSYSLYLIHILIARLFLRAYATFVPEYSIGYVLLSLFCTVSCVVIAIVLYQFVEKRMLNVLHSFVVQFRVWRLRQRVPA